MTVDHSRILPYAIAALAILMVYRRLRRNFGRQALQPVRLKVRIGILAVLACVLVAPALKSIEFLAAVVAGLAVGIGLGLYGAERTRFQRAAGQLYFVPHTVTGIAVSLLLVGRVAYRMVTLYFTKGGHGATADPTAADPSAAFSSPAMMQSPLTLGFLFVVVGYYVCYYSIVLWKSKRIGPEDLEAPSTSSAAPL
jgi:hypothetical protein